MSTPRDGGPAFPYTRVDVSPSGTMVTTDQPGLSMLDYYAGQALSGFTRLTLGMSGWNADQVAEHCWDIAQAMIRRRPE